MTEDIHVLVKSEGRLALASLASAYTEDRARMNRRPPGDSMGTSATMPQLAREQEAFGMERLP